MGTWGKKITTMQLTIEEEGTLQCKTKAFGGEFERNPDITTKEREGGERVP